MSDIKVVGSSPADEDRWVSIRTTSGFDRVRCTMDDEHDTVIEYRMTPGMLEAMVEYAEDGTSEARQGPPPDEAENQVDPLQIARNVNRVCWNRHRVSGDDVYAKMDFETFHLLVLASGFRQIPVPPFDDDDVEKKRVDPHRIWPSLVEVAILAGIGWDDFMNMPLRSVYRTGRIFAAMKEREVVAMKSARSLRSRPAKGRPRG